MSEAKVTLTAEDKGLLALYEKERQANERKQRALESAHRVAKASYNEEKQLAADAAKALQSQLSPIERLKQEREKLRKQLTLGIIDEKQYQQLLKSANQRFTEAKKNTEEYRAAQKKLADDQRRGAEITRSLETAQERYNRKVAEARALLAQGAISQETFTRRVREARTEMMEVNTSADAAAGAVKGFIAGFLGLAGIHKLLQGITSELDHFQQLAADANLENLDFAQVVKGTRNAFTADATLSDEQLEERLIDAGVESRTDPKVFAAAMQDVFSAKGDATNEEAVQAGIAAFRLNPGDLQSGRTLAARALDVRQATGSTDFMANIGFIQNIQANARATELQAVGKHLIPAISGIMTRGDSAEQAAELTAALNTLMQDEEGARTKTAAISLSGQLRAFQPKSAADQQAFSAAGSTTERMALLQQNPALAQEFLQGASFEQQAAPFVEKLVMGTADAMAVQAEKQAKIRPLDAQQAADLETRIVQKESSERARQLKAREQAEVNATASALRNLDRSEIGNVRASLDETLAKVDLPGIDSLTRAGANRIFEARTKEGMDPNEAGILMLEGIQSNALGSLDSRDQETVDKQIAIFREMLELQKENNRLMREGANVPRPAAAAPAGMPGRRPPAAALGSN